MEILNVSQTCLLMILLIIGYHFLEIDGALVKEMKKKFAEESEQKFRKENGRDLSEQEIKDTLTEMVNMFDEDGDGKVDRDELKAWLRSSDKVIPNRMMKEEFDFSDANEDGFVTWPEHLNNTFGIEEPQEIRKSLKGNYDHKRKTFAKIKEDEELFKAADKNGDDKLDKTEFPSFSIPEYDISMANIILKHAIGGRDKNGDGKITLDEYLSQTDSYHAEDSEERAQAMFKTVLDKNGDGVLDKEELKSYYIPDSEDAIQREEEHLMKEGDQDGDNHLSVDEILNVYGLFMESDITQFGDHVHDFEYVRDEL